MGGTVEIPRKLPVELFRDLLKRPFAMKEKKKPALKKKSRKKDSLTDGYLRGAAFAAAAAAAGVFALYKAGTAAYKTYQEIKKKAEPKD